MFGDKFKYSFLENSYSYNIPKSPLNSQLKLIFLEAHFIKYVLCKFKN